MRNHVSGKKCTICGSESMVHTNKAFLGGYVCEECISYIRSSEI